MLLDQELERKTKELEAIIEAEERLDKLSKELDTDLKEMSRHQVYQKYAYMNLKEITDIMLENPSGEDLEF